MSSSRKARILSPDPEGIAEAVRHLRAGQVVGMPTETVYGLAGNALDPSALSLIFSTKERPTFDPLIVHVAGLERKDRLAQLESLHLVDATSFSRKGRERVNLLMEKFWPGPLTLVLPKAPAVPDLATSGLPSVGIRMPSHPVAQALLEASGLPLAAPSANRFGRISPTSPEDVMEELGDRIDLILDGGHCEVGVESTVIQCQPDGELLLLRPGGTSAREIEQITGEALATVSKPESLVSPGMLESHYAPGKSLYLLPGPVPQLNIGKMQVFEPALGNLPPASTLAVLLMSGDAKAAEEKLAALTGLPIIAKSLSRSGDTGEAARNLFSFLRELDHSHAAVIFAEPCLEERGLGHAISDRLRRASFRQKR